MTIRVADAATLAACNAIDDSVDGGAGAGKLLILDGAVLLATLTFSDPAFGAAATTGDDAVATANSITSDTSVIAGTADNYIVEDSNGDDLWTGNVATSGADLNLDDVVFCTGGTVAVSSLTVTVPRE